MKALLVKEDGLIYAAEVPEKPSKPGPMDHQEFHKEYYEDDLPLYYADLDAAKDSAVLVSDQEKAVEVLREHHYPYGRHLDPKDYPGIYPIPDLDWTTVDAKVARILSTDGKHKQMPLTGQIAILKESTPSETESQEELWMGTVILVQQVIEKFGISKTIQMLQEQFTITRKP